MRCFLSPRRIPFFRGVSEADDASFSCRSSLAERYRDVLRRMQLHPLVPYDALQLLSVHPDGVTSATVVQDLRTVVECHTPMELPSNPHRYASSLLLSGHRTMLQAYASALRPLASLQPLNANATVMPMMRWHPLWRSAACVTVVSGSVWGEQFVLLKGTTHLGKAVGGEVMAWTSILVRMSVR